MICGTFTLKDIPATQVADVVSRFKATIPAPTSVSKTKQADGTWTVVAKYPPCPPNTTHTAS